MFAEVRRGYYEDATIGEWQAGLAALDAIAERQVVVGHDGVALNAKLEVCPALCLCIDCLALRAACRGGKP